jgi:hypothetical protein
VVFDRSVSDTKSILKRHDRSFQIRLSLPSLTCPHILLRPHEFDELSNESHIQFLVGSLSHCGIECFPNLIQEVSSLRRVRQRIGPTDDGCSSHCSCLSPRSWWHLLGEIAAGGGLPEINESNH